SCPRYMLGFGALGSSDNQDVRSVHEKAGLDDAGNMVQGHFELSRLVNPGKMDIHDQVTCLGFKWGTVSLPRYHQAFRECFDFAHRTAPAKGDYFDGERERSSENGDPFGMVNHDNELLG